MSPGILKCLFQLYCVTQQAIRVKWGTRYVHYLFTSSDDIAYVVQMRALYAKDSRGSSPSHSPFRRDPETSDNFNEHELLYV